MEEWVSHVWFMQVEEYDRAKQALVKMEVQASLARDSAAAFKAKYLEERKSRRALHEYLQACSARCTQSFRHLS